MAKYSTPKSQHAISKNAAAEVRRAVRNLGAEAVKAQLGVDKRQLQNWMEGKGRVNRNDVKRIHQLEPQVRQIVNWKDKFDERKINLLQEQARLRESRGKIVMYEPPKTVAEARGMLDRIATLQNVTHKNKADRLEIVRLLIRLGENPHAPHTYRNGRRIAAK